MKEYSGRTLIHNLCPEVFTTFTRPATEESSFYRDWMPEASEVEAEVSEQIEALGSLSLVVMNSNDENSDDPKELSKIKLDPEKLLKWMTWVLRFITFYNTAFRKRDGQFKRPGIFRYVSIIKAIFNLGFDLMVGTSKKRLS